MRPNLTISFALVLAVFVLLFGPSLPAKHEGRMTGSAAVLSADRPVAEICLPDTASKTCAALFLDEDGYELCLRDGAKGRVRCLNEFGDADRDPEHQTDSLRTPWSIAL